MNLKQKPKRSERYIELALKLCAQLTVVITLGIILVLGVEAFQFFTENQVGIVDFLFGSEWLPQSDKFGMLPFLISTAMTSVVAMLTAMPTGIFAAIYLSKYAGKWVRSVLKPVIELLASIPSVVLGYFALTFITPLLKSILGDGVVQFYNRLSAGIALGILIWPMITTICEDALSAVPAQVRSASDRLGSTKFETNIYALVPAAFSGIAAAFVLGFSRAIGETMIVALAAGAGPNSSLKITEFGETITGYIARISGGDISYGSLDYQSLFALGFVLLVITYSLNHFGRIIANRLREEY